MNTIEETKRRLEVMDSLKVQLSDCLKGIMMGGSMGFGQNYSVHEKSDIDLVLICDKDNVDLLLEKPFFSGSISPEVAQLFKDSTINLFWNTKTVNGIEVNAFVYEPAAYRSFCLLKGDLQIFIKTKPADTQSAYGFDGTKLTFNRNVRAFKDGFLFTKPSLANGKFWGGVPRQDFFYSGVIVHETDGFLSKLEKEVWAAVVGQLIKEHGTTVDLKSFNILNTHFTFQTAPERLPQVLIEKINTRTNEEIQVLSS